MPYVEEHGGGCCGVSHVSDFPHRPTKRDIDTLDRIMKDTGDVDNWGYDPDNGKPEPKVWGHTLEATLVDDQMIAWAPLLKERGWRLVNRFLNDNSGNVVNVLLYTTKGTNRPRPFKW